MIGRMPERAIAPAEKTVVPTGPSYRKLLRSTPVLFGGLGPLLVVRNGPASVLAASVVVLTLAAMMHVLRRERIVVTTTHIRSMRVLGWPRKRKRDDVATVVSVRVTSSSGGEAWRNLILLDHRERLIARLKGPRWTPADMRQLVSVLGVKPHELEGTVTARRLGQRFPRAVPMSERYPFVYGAAAGLLLAAAVVTASVLLG